MFENRPYTAIYEKATVSNNCEIEPVRKFLSGKYEVPKNFDKSLYKNLSKCKEQNDTKKVAKIIRDEN